MTPSMIVLSGSCVEHGVVELGLRGLDRDLLSTVCLRARQEGVAARGRVVDVRIAEADVQRGLALDALERAVDRTDGVVAGLIGPRLEIGLVDLHDIGAGGEEIASSALTASA